MSDEAFDVVVLAADRGPDDPVAAAGKAPGKVLVEVAGRPMLSRVLDALRAVSGIGEVIVVCPATPAYATALSGSDRVERIEPAEGPAASVEAAFARRRRGGALLVVTGDHALLRPDWVSQFVDRARATGCDAAVGIVDHAAVAKRFPESRRTRYRFADVAVCGANLFFFAGDTGRRAVSRWRAFEAHRKRPWRIIAELGAANLLRYLLGRLTLAQATRRLSDRLGVAVAAVFIDDPRAAVDVDSVADLEHVRALCAGEPGPGP